MRQRPRGADSRRRSAAASGRILSTVQPSKFTASSESLTVRRLEALLEVTSVVRGEKDLPSALATMVDTVAEALEFRTVVLNLYRPQFDDFCVTNVHGNAAAREALLGCTYEWGSWKPLLAEQYRRGGAYLITHGSFDWSEDTGSRYVPKVEASDDPDAWHPEDELFVPLEDRRAACSRSSPWRAALRPGRRRRSSMRSSRWRVTPRSRSRLRSRPRAWRGTAPASSSCSTCRRR